MAAPGRKRLIKTYSHSGKTAVAVVFFPPCDMMGQTGLIPQGWKGEIMITYRTLLEREIHRELFRHFIRRQVVTKCWRRRNGTWTIQEDPFIDQWTEKDYGELISGLRETIRFGGLVYGAFDHNRLKGFVAVGSRRFGSARQYLDLIHIYVSEDKRGQGIGKALFEAAKAWAKAQGAEKLYISAHSAVESQAFYRKMGCVEAEEYSREHVEKEPYDCQMEYVL